FVRAETRHPIYLRIGHPVEVLVVGSEESFEEFAIPFLAGRQAGSLADQQVPRRLDDAALAGIEFFPGRRMPYDQTSRDLVRAPVEPLRSWAVGDAGGADDAHTHGSVAHESPDC